MPQKRRHLLQPRTFGQYQVGELRQLLKVEAEDFRLQAEAMGYPSAFAMWLGGERFQDRSSIHYCLIFPTYSHRMANTFGSTGLTPLGRS